VGTVGGCRTYSCDDCDEIGAHCECVTGGDDDEVYDDFEDLETGTAHAVLANPIPIFHAQAKYSSCMSLRPHRAAHDRCGAAGTGEVHKADSKSSDAAGGSGLAAEDADGDEDGAGEMMDGDTEESKRQEILKKKQALKESFNAE
jgi:hypothetical protein